MSIFTHVNHPGKFFELSRLQNGQVQYREIGRGRVAISEWNNTTMYGKFSKTKFRFYSY